VQLLYWCCKSNIFLFINLMLGKYHSLTLGMDTTPVTEKTLEPRYGESYGICENPDHGPLELEEWEL
jgi:hypothetical protein